MKNTNHLWLAIHKRLRQGVKQINNLKLIKIQL